MSKKIVLTVFVILCLVSPTVSHRASNTSNTTLETTDSSRPFFDDPSYDDNISEMIDRVNKTRIRQYIQTLQDFETRYIGTEGNQEATEWLKEKFASFGVKTRYQNFTYKDHELSNVIATQEGVNPQKDRSTMIISGHFDSISQNKTELAPGADDDASGVAATLETARILSRYNFSRTIKYCAWNAEEVGLVGSRYFVETLEEKDIKVDAMYQYDMIGYSSNGSKEVKIHADHKSEDQLDHMIQIDEIYENQVNITPRYNSNMGASDHAYFWSNGYNATMTIEKVFSPYYHSTNDTIDKMSMSMVRSVTQLSVGSVAHLAGLIKPDPFLFYLRDPTPGSIHPGGESLGFRWFVAHENITASQLEVEFNYSTGNETAQIGSFQGIYRTSWDVPEIDEDITVNCKVVSPDNTTLLQKEYNFTVDSIHPEVVNIEPSSGTYVDNDIEITVEFSESMGPETVDWDNVYFEPKVDYYNLDLLENGTSLKISPVFPLEKNLSYTLFWTNITDKAGNTLSEKLSFSFTTRPNEPPETNFTFEPEQPSIYQTVSFTSLAKDDDGGIEEHLWDFGGAKNSTEEDPEIVFEETGEFQVSLTVWDQEGASSSFDRTVKVTDPVQGNISMEPNEPEAADRIEFTFEHTNDVDIENFSWSFGDDTTSQDEAPSHIYDGPGAYTVNLKAELEQGYTYLCNRTIHVRNTPPKADFDVSSGSNPNRYVFEANCTDHEGEIKNITWYFGDGTIGHGKKVVHNYSEGGTYNVTIEVTDGDGSIATHSKDIEVQIGSEKGSSSRWVVLSLALVIILLLLLKRDEEI